MDIKTVATIPVKVAMMGASERSAALRVFHPKIPCSKGCCACCKRYILVTLAEAVVLVEFLKENDKWEKVKEIAEGQRQIQAEPLVWFKLGIPCPILSSDGLCNAYLVRPVVCSTHFVTSAPEACSPMSTSLNPYEPFNFLEVHMDFIKSFDRILKTSSLRIRAPMHLALLMADKLSMNMKSEFEEMIAILSKELKS